MALCSSCRQTLSRRILILQRPSLRYVATAPSTPNAPPSTPPPSTAPSNSPEAISSKNPSGPQPFSTPHFAPASVTKANKPSKKGPRIPSRVPGGSELKGLGYTKAQPTVVAKEDDEYPSWLWTLLDQPKADGVEAPKANVAGWLEQIPCPRLSLTLLGMTKQQRNKYDRKQERLRKTMPAAIPLHEQSADLTGPEDDALVSMERRQELTKSARVARRKAIREENFLRSM